jgi:protein BUR2
MVTATSSQARRERPRPPPPAVVEAEQQWIFTEDELLQAPTIVDGMAAEEERTLRRKGVNFILQVGMMLKLPQTTLSTAAVFFNRFMMRNSLKPKPGFKPLHHYVSVLLLKDWRIVSDNPPASCRDCLIPRHQGRGELS